MWPERLVEVMRTRIWAAALLGSVLAAVGCQGTHTPKGLAATEPPLNTTPESGSLVVEAPPPKAVTWVDRHPLFSKPREYYDRTGTGKAGKIATATVVGIPAGIVGEIKQVVVGRPPDASAF